MSDIQNELNNRTIKCIKRKTGIDLTDPEVSSNLSLEERALIQEHGFKCALEIFRKTGKKKFRAWALTEYEKIKELAEEIGKRVIRFSLKMQDPIDVIAELNLLTSILENLVNDLDEEDLFSDTQSLLRFLLITSFSDTSNRIFINSMKPQIFTMRLAQVALGKDNSWCTSVLALTIEEQFIKRKAVELGIDMKKGEKYYSILKKLTAYLAEKNIRQSRELLLADSHRKIRNKVLHENWNPTDDETNDIIAHVSKLIEFLSSKYEIEKKK